MSGINRYFSSKRHSNVPLKNEKVKKHRASENRVLSSSDEDPLPAGVKSKKRGSRALRLASDDDEEPCTHHGGVASPHSVSKSKQKGPRCGKVKEEVRMTDDLYESIKTVDPTPARTPVDPASYFENRPLSVPGSAELLPRPKSFTTSTTPRKRKSILAGDHEEFETTKSKKSRGSWTTVDEGFVKRDDNDDNADFVVERNKEDKRREESFEEDGQSGGKKKGWTPESKAKFIQALQRDPPRFLGTRPIPVGAKNCLEGFTFVITGILEYIDRNDAQMLVERHGGRVTGAVSKKTTYLIVGREPGESKLRIAIEKGTPTLNEDEFFNLISSTRKKESIQVSPTTKHVEPKKKPVVQTPKTKSEVTAEPSNVVGALFVDKYRPTQVNHIVGHNGPKGPVNKLSAWLKSWHMSRTNTAKKNFFAAKEDGSIFKAALLSGPPGVGKSTTATLCCKELGFDFQELNASNIRSKKCLDTFLAASLQSCKIMMDKISSKSAIIMDEVDGMSGNEDRGGIQELIALIKTSNVPVICICNDRNHQKIRSLANHCFDIRFNKPRVQQVREFLLDVARKEGLNISPQAADQIISAAHNDIRQILNNIQCWSASKRSFDYDDAKAVAYSAEKDVHESIFEVVKKIFTNYSSSKTSVSDKSDLFFYDYTLIPLFVFENYLSTISKDSGENRVKQMKNIARSADSLSHGEECERLIRSQNAWSLLPTQAIFSCVIPSEYMSGVVGGMVTFPQWLGKNSTSLKNDRCLQTLALHAKLSCNSCKASFALDYIPYFHNFLYLPLLTGSVDGVGDVIRTMEGYSLTRDDWNSIVDLCQWMGFQLGAISTKIKTSFTKSVNGIHRQLPYALSASVSSASLSTTNDRAGGDTYGEGETYDPSQLSDVEPGSTEQDAMLREIKTPNISKGPAKKAPRRIKTK